MGVWYAWPLALLLGMGVGLQLPSVWPVSRSLSAGALALLSLAACGAWAVWGGHRAWPSRGQAWRLTASLLALATLGCTLVAMRTAGRVQAVWPAEMGVLAAGALVQVDSLPQPMSQGAWSVDAEVLQWVPPAQTGAGAGPRATLAAGDVDAIGQSAVAPARGRHASTRPGHEPGIGPADASRLSRVNRVRIYWPAGAMPEPGSRWQLRARWHRPDGVSNPGGPDAELLAWERGIGAVGQVGKQAAYLRLVSPAHPWSPCGLIDRWRARLRERIGQTVPEPALAGVLAGLTVGDQSAVARDDWEVFRRTGVAHLISISGSHIAVVGWWVAWLVRRQWGRSHRLAHACPAPWAAQGLSLAVCAAYALLSGWGLPAQRTVWTMLGLSALRAGGRDWPWTLSSLWVMAAVALIDPWALLQAGFWLSFLCVVALMAMGDGVTLPTAMPQRIPAQVSPGRRAPGWLARARTEAWPKARAELVGLVRVQGLLTLAMAPVAVVCFNQVSLAGFLVNLVAIPLFDVCMTPLALVGMLWSGLWRLDATLLAAFMAALRWVAAAPWAVWVWPTPPAWLGAWGVVAGLMWVWPGPRGWRLGWAMAMLPLLCLPPAWHLLPAPASGQFQALAIDIGQGTAVLVQTHRHALLFDTGPKMGEDQDAGGRHILPSLQAMGVTGLDVLLISHEDSDHVGGALSVMQALPVTQVVSSLVPDHPVRAWQSPRTGQPLPHAPCQAGLSWDWDGVHFELLHPLTPHEVATSAEDGSLEEGRTSGRGKGQGEANEPNAHSCVLKVSQLTPARAASDARSLLLTADIEADQEAALVDWARSQDQLAALQATVLVAPHHGSQTSSTLAFLQAVSPAQVVVQAGRRNRYGHPAPSVIRRYEAMGLPWVATPDCGAWWWRSDEPVNKPGERADRSVGQQPALGHCWRARRPHAWQVQPEASPA
jgi:competence protein ComEC